jgi:hypothetical protein
MADDDTDPAMPPPGESTETVVIERPSRWHRVRARALKTVAFTLLGLVALAVAVIFGIDTGPGRRFVADEIAGLRFENGMRITVGRIEGSLYGKMTLHHLSVRDTKGEFLFSPQVEVDWRQRHSAALDPAAFADLPADAAQRCAAIARPRHRCRHLADRPLHRRTAGLGRAPYHDHSGQGPYR